MFAIEPEFGTSSELCSQRIEDLGSAAASRGTRRCQKPRGQRPDGAKNESDFFADRQGAYRKKVAFD
ncbi:hypothetical protein [Helcobacillus massiliensis]|uniref:hypothetical protein n=1 Tax=Helcobacillus massiliensis TaxID=521392 RepID=UPI002556A41E|nr:hypothetical protein [Helcobacillus massiliensis]MDK7741810.1 hypothetical protein [Helcobacillus massiliensis]WOO92999.1 hypothetical protein R3I40_11455 [Helcobacillus massiliensis]